MFMLLCETNTPAIFILSKIWAILPKRYDLCNLHEISPLKRDTVFD